jgi:hypothetical protein
MLTSPAAMQTMAEVEVQRVGPVLGQHRRRRQAAAEKAAAEMEPEAEMASRFHRLRWTWHLYNRVLE